LDLLAPPAHRAFKVSLDPLAQEALQACKASPE
jgi:hypothetical protein